jgi:RNA polymerase sigma factor (sigma-70 family)
MFKVPRSGMFRLDSPAQLRPLVAPVADPDDVEWLRALYNEHSDHVRNVIVRHGGPGFEPEDLVQDVFLAAHRKIQQLRNYAVPRAWLHVAALREVWKVRRRRLLLRLLPLGSALPVQDPPAPDVEFERREARAAIYRMLDKLPRRQRDAIVLFHLEGFTSEEISRLLGCPEETVRTRICYGRRTLMKMARRHSLRDVLGFGGNR